MHIEFSTKLDPEIREFSQNFVDHVLDGCDPGRLVRQGVDFNAFTRPTHILAFGKASVGMSSACVELLGDRFAGGIVLAPESTIPTKSQINGLRYIPVDHPIPTQRNIAATQCLAEYARSIPQNEACIVCISGGGSAHLCSPKPGITLDQIIQISKHAMERGASIHELNHERRALETLKGGGLADLLSDTHHCETIVLSDVVDDDLDSIASGPMMDPGADIKHTIIGSHLTVLEAARCFFSDLGFENYAVESHATGDARLIGKRIARAYIELNRNSTMGICFIAGETTVDTRGAKCVGVGGPILESTLAGALELAKGPADDQWLNLGLATDGIDGPSGAAGAVITSKMFHSRESDRELFDAAERAIQDHDSMAICDLLGATFRTGPTGTNLNDICIVCPMKVINRL